MKSACGIYLTCKSVAYGKGGNGKNDGGRMHDGGIVEFV